MAKHRFHGAARWLGAGLVLWLSGVGATPAWAQQPRAALLVSPAELAARLDDPGLVVLQVDRDSTAYRAGHIPGARLVPLDAIVTSVDGVSNELPPPGRLDSLFERLGVSTDSRIVIAGEPLPAARLFFTLDYLGAGDRLALLDGGPARWKAEGRPLSTTPWSGRRGRLHWTLRQDLVVDAPWVRTRLADPAIALLDARPTADFGPHIPGAGSLPWGTLLTADEPTRLQNTAALSRRFGQAGLAPGETPVVYCRTGMQASFLYFVARYLGWAPRLYDGSFEDWSKRPGYPVGR
jgi:thiosulfate/3-mercaptopyruvate sulfurtransferase